MCPGRIQQPRLGVTEAIIHAKIPRYDGTARPARKRSDPDDPGRRRAERADGRCVQGRARGNPCPARRRRYVSFFSKNFCSVHLLVSVMLPSRTTVPFRSRAGRGHLRLRSWWGDHGSGLRPRPARDPQRTNAARNPRTPSSRPTNTSPSFAARPPSAAGCTATPANNALMRLRHQRVLEVVPEDPAEPEFTERGSLAEYPETDWSRAGRRGIPATTSWVGPSGRPPTASPRAIGRSSSSRTWRGCRIEEISEMLGISVPAKSRAQLHRARLALRPAIDDFYKEV